MAQALDLLKAKVKMGTPARVPVWTLWTTDLYLSLRTGSSVLGQKGSLFFRLFPIEHDPHSQKTKGFFFSPLFPFFSPCLPSVHQHDAKPQFSLYLLTTHIPSHVHSSELSLVPELHHQHADVYSVFSQLPLRTCWRTCLMTGQRQRSHLLPT